MVKYIALSVTLDALFWALIYSLALHLLQLNPELWIKAVIVIGTAIYSTWYNYPVMKRALEKKRA